jgi:hypothetical protein
VRVPLDSRFDRERTTYRLVFTCEDCVHHDSAAQRCAHGYPTEPHAAAAFDAGGARNGMFCKEFEID